MLPVPYQSSRTPSQDADYSKKLFLSSFPSLLLQDYPKFLWKVKGTPFMIRLIAGVHFHGLHNRKTRERKK